MKSPWNAQEFLPQTDVASAASNTEFTGTLSEQQLRYQCLGEHSEKNDFPADIIEYVQYKPSQTTGSHSKLLC